MNIRREWLEDAVTSNADFALQCPRCPREVVIERTTFRAIASAWGIGKHQKEIASRLRCTGCGHRPCRLVYASRGRPEALTLRDGDPMPPKGFPLARWFTLPKGEQRRIQRSMRG